MSLLFLSLHCIKATQGGWITFSVLKFWVCLTCGRIFQVYFWLKRYLIIQSFYSVSLGSVSAGLDMSRMVLWACMLSSHFSPQNFSTVTLWTVPGSRQCGAIPVGEDNSSKGQLVYLHMNKRALCLWHISMIMYRAIHTSLPFSNYTKVTKVLRFYKAD